MTEISDLTVVVAGPLAQRSPLMAALERSGCRLEPSQGARGHHWGFADLRDDGTLGSVAVRHADVDHVAGVARQSGWALRMHWHTPNCQACNGIGKANHGTTGLGTCLHCQGTGRSNQPVEDPLVARLKDLESRLAAVEGRR